MDKWRALVILVLSLELTFLGAITALGHVTKELSYGLEIIYMALGGALAATLVMKDPSPAPALKKE
jgi:Na+/proline symporter